MSTQSFASDFDRLTPVRHTVGDTCRPAAVPASANPSIGGNRAPRVVTRGSRPPVAERGKPKSPEGHQLNYRSITKLHNVLDGLAMNLEKGYRPAGDLIIEDADHQPAGIPSLCIEVCPTFYRDWTIPELVMPVHDMSVP